MDIKICFAASTGGHYEQLLHLEPLMHKYNSFLLTEDTGYKTAQKGNITTYYLKQINRREKLFPIYLLINIFRSIRIYSKERPNIIITTGVLSMIPICLIAKLFRKKVIYIESFSKTTTPTLTGKFLYKFSNQFYVQWKNLLECYPKAIYKGGLY